MAVSCHGAAAVWNAGSGGGWGSGEGGGGGDDELGRRELQTVRSDWQDQRSSDRLESSRICHASRLPLTNHFSLLTFTLITDYRLLIHWCYFLGQISLHIIVLASKSDNETGAFGHGDSTNESFTLHHFPFAVFEFHTQISRIEQKIE